MKCPKCGRELNESDLFCPSCGARIPSPDEERHDPMNAYAVRRNTEQTAAGPEKPSRPKLILKAVCAVLLYLSFYFVIQSCVISNYLLSSADMSELSAAVQSGDPAAAQDASARFMQSALDLVAENETKLLLIASLLAVAALCVLLRLRKKTPYDEFDFHAVNPLRLVQFALFGVSLNVALSVFLSLIPIPEKYAQMQETQYAGLMEGNLFWAVLSVGIVGPAAEEIFFRGMAMSRLKPAVGDIGAVVISAILFGFAHVTPLAVGYAFLIGLLLALIYRRYGSILPGTVCHCFFNLTSLWLYKVENETALIVMTVVSAVLVLLIWHSAVTRFPTFTDVLCDAAGKIRPDDPEKRAIAEECRRIRASADREDRAGQLEQLAARWERAERKDAPYPDLSDDGSDDSENDHDKQ